MQNISVNKLKTIIDQVLLIDVREPEEYAIQHIKNSLLIPLGEISLEKIPKTNKPIIVYCKAGKRSMDACTKLLSQDSSLNIASLDGGITAWADAGEEVVNL